MSVVRRRRRYGAVGGDIYLSLSNVTGLIVDPSVEIVVVTEASTPEVRWDGGTWTAWTPGMVMSDLVDVIPLSATSYLLEARASGVDPIGLNVTVPTFVQDATFNEVIDASGNYAVQ